MKPLPTDVDLLAWAGLQESQYLEPTTTFADDLASRFRDGVQIHGEKLPWQKTHDKVRIRDGEVSLWFGYNGHGKSLVLGQVLLWMPRDIKIVIASLEMKPVATLERACRQTLGGGYPTQQYISEFIEKTDNIYIYDQNDSVQADRILGLCHYAAQEFGAKQIMIDSLMKCGISPEDYPRQKEFVDRLCWCAKSENIHIHLVHHARKGKTELDIPDKHDAKGAGEITDLVDNVFIVHRNKEKERKREESKKQNQPFHEDSEPDSRLIVAKQRHGEWEGAFGLWFHKESTQYVNRDLRATKWRAQA